LDPESNPQSRRSRTGSFPDPFFVFKERSFRIFNRLHDNEDEELDEDEKDEKEDNKEDEEDDEEDE